MSVTNQLPNSPSSGTFLMVDEACFRTGQPPTDLDGEFPVLYASVDFSDDIPLTEDSIHGRIDFLPLSDIVGTRAPDAYIVSFQVGPELFSWQVNTDDAVAMRCLSKWGEEKHMAAIIWNPRTGHHYSFGYELDMVDGVQTLMLFHHALGNGLLRLGADGLAAWQASRLEAWPTIVNIHRRVVSSAK